jgi:hypothetical protein
MIRDHQSGTLSFPRQIVIGLVTGRYVFGGPLTAGLTRRLDTADLLSG